MEKPDYSADAMKAAYKKRCGTLGQNHRIWQVRVHRSLSWLKRSAQFTEDQGEAKFLYLWIAFNSLYSRWDNVKNQPGPDAEAREQFLRRLCGWDESRVLLTLRESRGLIKKVLENPFLAADFWRQTDHPKAKGWATADANYLDKHIKDREPCVVLGQVLQRLAVFRGQIVHGASSGGSKLNRGSLKYCTMTLDVLVPLMIHVVIEHGCNDGWPDLCYPPIV